MYDFTLTAISPERLIPSCSTIPSAAQSENSWLSYGCFKLMNDVVFDEFLQFQLERCAEKKEEARGGGLETR